MRLTLQNISNSHLQENTPFNRRENYEIRLLMVGGKKEEKTQNSLSDYLKRLKIHL